MLGWLMAKSWIHDSESRRSACLPTDASVSDARCLPPPARLTPSSSRLDVPESPSGLTKEIDLTLGFACGLSNEVSLSLRTS